jgi:cytochrome c553
MKRRNLAMTTIATFALGVSSPAAAQIATENVVFSAKAVAVSQPPPDWAYAVDLEIDTATEAAISTATTPLRIPGSEATFTLSQINDLFRPPDWHPEDHPAMPRIVAAGRAPDVFACGYCHLPNGQGRPENSRLAGLPIAYIVQQLADFKSGARKSSEPKHKPTSAMITFETKATQEEIRSAAEYFSKLKPRPWVRVVETDTVPQTHVAGWMLVPIGAGEMELIGHRIIETPENLERTELRDDHSGFIAYVPPGSLKKGEALVETGRGRAASCSTCHGPGMKGLGSVPGLAGRSPSYVVRQLYDLQSGARAGIGAQKMKPIVSNMTLDEMIAIAAYTASLRP